MECRLCLYNYFTIIYPIKYGKQSNLNSEPVNVYNSFLDQNDEIQGYGIFAVSSKDSIIIHTE